MNNIMIAISNNQNVTYLVLCNHISPLGTATDTAQIEGRL